MVAERWRTGLAVFALAISIGGCGADEPAAPPEEVVDPGDLDEGEKEICLFGMDCYDPDNSGPSGEEIFAEVDSGFPAPGSICPVPEPWGFNLTQHMDNTQLVDCDGNPVYMHDEFCGATVGWLYFFRGAG